MKVAIDVSPLKSGNYLWHRVRGTGFYIENLKNSLLNFYSNNDYVFFSKGEKLPLDTNIVHIPYFEPFFLTLPFKKKFQTVVTVHDLTPLVFPEYFPSGIKGKLKWQIQKNSLRKADAVITDSESSKKDIIKYAGISSEKVHVVYLAAGEEFTRIEKLEVRGEKLREKYNLPEKFVLYVGDVTWNKNLPRLLDAINKINTPLVMVGKALVEKDFDKTNPWNQDLIKVQKMVQNNKKIQCLGFVSTEDLVMIYNAATLFVMPSLYEGFGLPVLEAMSCGCPVVTSKEGSIAEVVGEAAYYVDAYSSDNISQGIIEVLNNNRLREVLAEKGFKRVKNFTWRKTVNKTVDIYKSLICGRLASTI